MNREQAERKLWALSIQIPNGSLYQEPSVSRQLEMLCKELIALLPSCSDKTVSQGMSIDCCSCHLGMAPCCYCERESALEGE